MCITVLAVKGEVILSFDGDGPKAIMASQAARILAASLLVVAEKADTLGNHDVQKHTGHSN